MATLHQRQLPLFEMSEHAAEAAKVIDTDRLQVITKHRLDGFVPPIVNVQRLGDALVTFEARAFKPVLDAIVAFAHRGLLQCFKR